MNTSSSRSKLFLENFFVYGLGGMISKLIPMIMLPILTRLYPNSEYIGLNDLSQTFISFAQALAICGMYDAMFRLFFDYKENLEQKRVSSTALIFVSCTSIVLSIVFYLLRTEIAILYFGDVKYESLVIITIIGFLLSSTNQIISAPTRIQNKRKIFLIANIVSSLLSYTIAIPLIMQGYYITAIPVAYMVAVITVEIVFYILNKDFFEIHCFDKTIIRDLLIIGLPLLPNFLIYWVYNSADRIMISRLIDNEATGVYSVAAKIGHISNLIYTAFAGGWQYFAYSTMHDDDQIQLKSNIYEYLAVISYAATVLLIVMAKKGFGILFPEEYLQGFLVAPYLFLSPLMLMLYQIIANQFTIVKKTYMNLLSLSVGAMVNIALNYCLIRQIGIEGAAIATLVGYILSNLFCLFILRRMNLILINCNVMITSVLFLAFFLIWRLIISQSNIYTLLAAIVLELVYGFLYRKQIIQVIYKITGKKGSRI